MNAILEIVENPYGASNIEMLSGYESTFKKGLETLELFMRYMMKQRTFLLLI